MAETKFDGIKLKEAIAQFGSLQKALEGLSSQKEVAAKELEERKKENQQSKLEHQKLLSDIEDLKKQRAAEKEKIEAVARNVGKWERQYKLFQGFVAMLLGSTSPDKSLANLISLLQELVNSGWIHTGKVDEVTGHFVTTVMGDYLRSFRCKACGAKFITNKGPHTLLNKYQCPSCHTSIAVEPDDSFLKAMLSDAQLKDILTTGEIQKENDALRPLKVFLGVTCGICGKPITEWNEQNVELAVEGFGWGHTGCWNSNVGQIRMMSRFTQEMNRDFPYQLRTET